MKKRHFDIVVVGGGPAGITASIAAARMGRSTALLERGEILGGMGTLALVNNFCKAHHDGSQFIIGGIFAEIRNALIQRGALFLTDGLEPYNHHVFLDVVKELCEEAGVAVFTGAHVKKSTFIEGESTLLELEQGELIEADAVVDASGDAVIAAAAGVPFLARRSDSRRLMPLTYCYVVGPVNLDQVRRELPEVVLQDRLNGGDYLYLGGQTQLREWVRAARECGDLTIPRERIAVAYSIPKTPENIAVNFGRVVVEDPTNPEQMKQAELMGKQQVDEGVNFFRKYIPGFENVELLELARQIGVRESRQIDGLYCLNQEDVLGCRQFEDGIAQCCYAIDIHEADSDKTTMISIPKGKHYDIPLRSLIPASGPSNLIVAGRSISATQEAMSSFRVSPSAMAIGEAAGVTAAIAVEEHLAICDVSSMHVRERLVATGGILD
ncbi:FAD-dependent oxidoreductase [Coraliomargarita sp. SDUM461004]|uniref:FAD-dependent oxidoreductase n=1 Tax=Thalassobacterium sedimentorum TaxID=3041258 RepID=A0ABU1AJ38_9BACT|nr:FAD-dependent oxidoreductase [Coraliomargarita sp. SDUM461004]MDQ8194788.1 FAD-dependent oxidoreductase [Coraliomargarita sp. SDUM461004]